MAETLYSKWIDTIDATGLSDQSIFAIGTLSVIIAVFWSINCCLYFFDLFGLFTDYKIQPDAKPDPKLVRDCLLHCVITHCLVAPVMLYYAFPAFTHFGMTVRGALPSIGTVMRDLLVSVALNDTLFYWAHRALHHKSIYKYIHKKHHLFKVPIGVSAIYAHPVEDFLANIFPTMAGCLFMGSHALVLWLWLGIRVWETVDAHSGYSFKLSPFHLLPFQGGSERHDYHHSHNVGCYGSFTIFWDHIMGTDKSFLEFQRSNLKQQQQKQQLKQE